MCPPCACLETRCPSPYGPLPLLARACVCAVVDVACPTGVLSTSAGAQCSFSTVYQSSILHMAQPKWLDTYEPRQWMHLAFNMTLASGVAGLVFRMGDVNNYYALVLNADTGTGALVMVAAGATTTLASGPLSGPAAATLDTLPVCVCVSVCDACVAHVQSPLR